ncbi:signal peptidase II [Bacteroidota bacterium]
MRVLYISLILFISDQITKLLVKGISIPFLGIEIEGFRYGESLNVIGNFFRITFVENPGMAFGIYVGEGSKLFLSLFSLVASVGLIVYLYKIRNDKLIIRIPLALILAGALGNLVDRTFYGLIYGYEKIFYGKVVDFLNVDFWDFTIFGRTYERWPIFNIADASVTIGVLMLIIFHRSSVKKESSNFPSESTESKESVDTPDSSSEKEKIQESQPQALGSDSGENNNREEV